MVEAAEVYRARKCTHGSLAPEIEIQIEVAHGQFAQGTIDRFTIAAAREVRFGDGAPMAVHPVNGHDVIGIMFGFEIQEQGWKTVRSQRSRGENGALQAVRGIFTQNQTRRPCSIGKVIRHVVEKSLDLMRVFQGAQLAY